VPAVKNFEMHGFTHLTFERDIRKAIRLVPDMQIVRADCSGPATAPLVERLDERRQL